MTRAEVEAILAEDAPGWRLSGDAWDNLPGDPDTVEAVVELENSAAVRKTVFLRNGRLVGDRQ